MTLIGPAATGSCDTSLVRLYSEDKDSAIWKFIPQAGPTPNPNPTPKPTPPPPPKRRPPPPPRRTLSPLPSPPPPPAVVDVQVPKVDVVLEFTNYTLETFGDSQKTQFCNDLIATSMYPRGKAFFLIEWYNGTNFWI